MATPFFIEAPQDLLRTKRIFISSGQKFPFKSGSKPLRTFFWCLYREGVAIHAYLIFCLRGRRAILVHSARVIDLFMGLFRGAIFHHGGSARKQPVKHLTEMPTSTMALTGRFPSLRSIVVWIRASYCPPSSKFLDLLPPAPPQPVRNRDAQHKLLQIKAGTHRHVILRHYRCDISQETRKEPEVMGSRSYQSSVTALFRGTKAPKTLALLCFSAIKEGWMIRD